MTEDPARTATVKAALSRVEPGMTLGLGSGRASFALTKAIGERFGAAAKLRVVTASPETLSIANDGGLEVIELTSDVRLDVAFDGADEVDHNLNLIKGGGAALLREKLTFAAADHVVILAEAVKLSEYLGTKHTLPVEVVPFAWAQTQQRVAAIIDDPAIRVDGRGTSVVTANGNFLLDGKLKEAVDLAAVAQALKLTLGVVEHGLFLTQAREIILGKPDGTSILLSRLTASFQ